MTHMDLCRQYLHIKSGIGYVCIHNIHHLIYKVLIRLIDLYLPDRYQWFGVLQADVPVFVHYQASQQSR